MSFIKKSILAFLSFFILTSLCFAQEIESDSTNNEPQEETSQNDTADNDNKKKTGGGTYFSIDPVRPNTIKPTWFMYEAKPGDVIEDEMYVRNTADYINEFYIYGTDGAYNEDGDKIFTIFDEIPSEAGSWFNFEETDYALEPHEVIKKKFTITIPENIEPKEYLGGIAAEKLVKGSSVNRAFRMVVPVNIKVTDNPQSIPLKPIPVTYTPFFWITLGIAIISFSYLAVSYIKRRGKK